MGLPAVFVAGRGSGIVKQCADVETKNRKTNLLSGLKIPLSVVICVDLYPISLMSSPYPAMGLKCKDGRLPSLSVRESQLLFYQGAQRVLNFSMPGHRCLLSIISVQVDVMLRASPMQEASLSDKSFDEIPSFQEKSSSSTRRVFSGRKSSASLSTIIL